MPEDNPGAYNGDSNVLLNRLKQVRADLTEMNTLNGNLFRVHAIKREISSEGWEGICKKYHPDANTEDPAAFELFRLYRFVYENMERI
jgi:hypothetical protein